LARRASIGGKKRENLEDGKPPPTPDQDLGSDWFFSRVCLVSMCAWCSEWTCN